MWTRTLTRDSYYCVVRLSKQAVSRVIVDRCCYVATTVASSLLWRSQL